MSGDKRSAVRSVAWHKLGLIFLLLLASLGSNCAGEFEESKLSELRVLASQTPVYPDFQPIGERTSTKIKKATLFKDYRSQASFADVKAFYDATLLAKGWGPPQQPPPSIIVGEIQVVEYHKGEFVLVVNPAAGGDVISLVFIWNSP